MPSSTETPPRQLRVGGLANFSTCDWPGELVATIFAQGCPWDCGYCHNPTLLPVKGMYELPWEEIVAIVAKRRHLLDGVVFSGGEPTLQAALPDAMRKMRDLGFRIGLHSAGPYPERLARVLPMIDWIGFDVKAPFDAYPQVTGVPGSGERALESLELVLGSGVSYEIRTTVHPKLLSLPMVRRLADQLRLRGVKNYALQIFRSEGCDNEELLSSIRFSTDELRSILEERFAMHCVRSA